MLRQQLFVQHIVKRYKNSKNHWAYILKKKTNRDKAIQHFDDFYSSVFEKRWGPMRAALLTEHKYVALINNFGDVEKTKELLESDGAINLRLIYEAMTNTEINPKYNPTPIPQDSVKNAAEIDRKLTDFLYKAQSTEIESIYQQNVDEGLEKFNLETREGENNRVIDSLEMANFRKSLEKTIQEDSEMDYNRMISAEIGAMGLQEFVPATKIKGMEDFVRESEHYQYYSTTVDFPIKIEPEVDFIFPENLNVYTYERGNVSRFRRTTKGLTKVHSHFLMDGASLLPALMLDVRAGETVYDACAAPGGKSLVMLQTMLPEVVVCNDVQESRTNRIRHLLKEYLIDFDKNWEGKRCIIRQEDARDCTEYGNYDKILVDVPCTTDRHSLLEDENNIFKSTRIKERLRIPELQSGILVNCIRLLKPGGSLVYSTCSLSPIQNDGVVHMALSKAFSEHRISVTIKDLSNIIAPLRTVYKFENPKDLKYGQLCLPYLPANFGPMYFCKLTRDF